MHILKIIENLIFTYLSFVNKWSAKCVGKCHGTRRDHIAGFMNCESYIREEERSGCRENDEKLISHGERILRSRTEIRRTNPINPRDDYWGKTADPVAKKLSWREDDWLRRRGREKQSKFAVQLICRFHATDTNGGRKFLIKDGRLPRDLVGKQCCFSTWDCFSKSNLRNIFNHEMFRMDHETVLWQNL